MSDHVHDDDHHHQHDDAHEHEHDDEPIDTHADDGGHSHDDEHSHDAHDHEHDHGRWGWLLSLVPFGPGHHHEHGTVSAAALESSARGIWALKISVIGLGLTSLFQLAIVLVSGSVGLLADTIHNFGDALTAVPLAIAFTLSRRAATRSYTYGYRRAEDVAGVLIVVVILISALIAAYESIQKIAHPQPLANLGWVMVAALVGFLGNEAVAIFRIRIGREIGSAALVADGLHARADGFTSLAVLVGALGVLVGFPLADPLVGLLISLAILGIVRETGKVMWMRIMDAVDPSLLDTIERTAGAVAGVQAVQAVRARWLGHDLDAELHITVDEDLPTRESHRIAEEVRHQLYHAMPRLADVIVHTDPCGHGGDDPHDLTAHHTTVAAATSH